MSAAEALKLIEQAAAEEWTKLDLSRRRLTEIPEEVAQLTNLNELNLGGNRITKIPRQIAKLSNLEELYLSENQITGIPEAITQLSNLTTLSLFNNQITEIPEAIAQLFNLSKLYLNGNQVSKIPEAIIQLTNLSKLYLFDNQITEIPEEIAKLPKLTEFFIDNNPIENIPREVLGQGSDRIINFLRQTLLQEKRPLHEAKMLLVGQGSVGKTSLINRLLHDEFDKDESQTDGLDVQTWPIDINGNDIRLNVWDFGGQEIYHATHQFFLTKRSLYLLVCNCRISEEENRLEYWLKLIQTFGDASPVIIVGNKKDEQPLDINRKALREKYPNICAILETSCQTGDGIQELSNEIYQQISQLKEVYDLLPLSWFEVKEQLEAMDEDFISYKRYIGICYENGVSEEQNQDQLIDLLHRLGLVLNFREHSLLQQTNVLKPEWATEGIYDLLSDDDLKTKSRGIFRNNDLLRILDSIRYPKERHQYLIELMKEFELCFELDCDPPRFLIPGILPKDEPNDTSLEGDTLEFQYHYHVLPNSIISRFIVNNDDKIHNETYWRSGVMLAYGEGSETCNIARIKSDSEDNKIFIAISGKPETRRTFLGLIRDVFNKLHKSFGNLEITEWVPVPGYPKHPPLDYQELLGLEEMGTQDYPIGKLKITVNIRDLLDGYESRFDRQQRQFKESHGKEGFPDEININITNTNQPMNTNYNNNFDNPNIANFANEVKDNATQQATNFTQNSGINTAELLEIINAMRNDLSVFPTEVQEDVVIDLDDLEAEIKKPKDKCRIRKIKKCLTALATAGTVAIAALSATNTATVQLTEFVDNASTLANKFEIELPIAAPAQNQTLPPAP